MLFNSAFVRQTEGLEGLPLQLDYAVSNSGARQQELTLVHDELYAANFACNNTQCFNR